MSDFRLIRKKEREEGQFLVILAFGMIVLLAFAGLALDGGILFARQAQLERAVDAAALAGVYELYTIEGGGETEDVNAANERAFQMIAANGVVLEQNEGQCLEHPVYEAEGDPDALEAWNNMWANIDMCGDRNVTEPTLPGALRYYVEAHWESETFFMSILGFENIRITAEAEAEYFPVVDIIASGTARTGIVRSSNQAIFGPRICTSYGDPYTPANSPYYDEISGRYTYRILIDEEFYETYDSPNPQTNGEPLVRIEIFDPDSHNAPNGNKRYYTRAGNSGTQNCNNRKNPCLANTGEPREANPFWFFNIDENRGNGNDGTCSNGSGYQTQYNTTTVYRLYYYKENVDGTLSQVDLAYYVGQPNNAATDMQWISPQPDTGDGDTDPRGPIDEWLLPPDPFDDGEFGGDPYLGWYWDANGYLLCNDELYFVDNDDDGVNDNAGKRHCVFADAQGLSDADSEPLERAENCLTMANTRMDYLYGALPDETFNPEVVKECSGNGDFTVNLDDETPDMFIDSRGNRYLYFEVIGVNGFSENGFELWAGPVPEVYELPAEVNSRNMFVVNMIEASQDGRYPELDPRDIFQQVQIYGLGRLPMNSNETARVEIPLTYLSNQFQGQQISIQHFDADSGARGPMYFFFENLPLEDWVICFGSAPDQLDGTCETVTGITETPSEGPSGIPSGNRWNDNLVFAIPGEEDGVAFYGDTLVASYRAGRNDSYGWKIVMESRPFLTK